MKNIDIVHIYHGSQGIGGLYLNEIYESLDKNAIKQEVLVSYYYKFNYGRKIFFKYTDLSSGKYKGKLRILFRAIEFLYGLIIAYIFLVKTKPKLINYSLNSAYFLDVLFLKLIQNTMKSKIIITCHDVLPLSENIQNEKKQISYRKKIFSLSHFLLVHNENSISDLINYFSVPKNKIYFHSFPIMDLNKIFSHPEKVVDEKFDFLFIGHLRKQKGIDTLVNAWIKYTKINPKARLNIVGNPINQNQKEYFTSLEKYNIFADLKYLSDQEYFDSISNAKTVILPYKNGTNSGVIFNLITMNVNILYSNLPMFLSNPLLKPEGMFASEDQLVKKIEEFYYIQPQNIYQEISKYRKEFDIQVLTIYSQLLHEN